MHVDQPGQAELPPEPGDVVVVDGRGDLHAARPYRPRLTCRRCLHDGRRGRRLNLVFKALADPARRRCSTACTARRPDARRALRPLRHVAPGRDAAPRAARSRHLVTTDRHGREKLHYLNPVPLHEIADRWIGKFERPAARVLRHQARAEEGDHDDRAHATSTSPTSRRPRGVWEALTDPDTTAAYWGHRNVSDWQPGSTWGTCATTAPGSPTSPARPRERPPKRLVTTGQGADGPLTPTSLGPRWTSGPAAWSRS